MTEISSITLLDHCTVEIRVEKDQEIDLETAISITNSIGELGNGRRLFYLTVFGERTVPSKQARDFFISEIGSRYKMAEAIVVTSLSQKMVFNFMINVERPSVRTKLFTDENEAKNWLKSLNN